MLDDETLRDGLQSPSVRTPTIEQKLRILHLIDALGIETRRHRPAGRRAARRRGRRAARARDRRREAARCAPTARRARVVADITPIVEISQRTGLADRVLHVHRLEPDPPVRRGLDARSAAAARPTRPSRSRSRQGLPVMYVTEDTTRADPESLRALYSTAIRAGRVARLHRRHGRPRDARRRARGRPLRAVDHRRVRRRRRHRLARPPRPRSGAREQPGRDGGRRDAPARRGARHRRARRQHADGPAARESGAAGRARVRPDAPARVLRRRCPRPAACRFPPNYPVIGRDAFRTATGVHAAAVIKAFKKHDLVLADAVYSGVPASLVGREQAIEIGPMSGRSNVVYWLEKRGLEATDERVDRILRQGQGVADRADRGGSAGDGVGGLRVSVSLIRGGTDKDSGCRCR